MRRLLLSIAPLVLVAACATQPLPAATAQSKDPGVSAYGLFLAGEGALNDGQSVEAAKYFELARAQSSGDPLVAERAFTAALLAGDITQASILAPVDEQATESSKRLGRLVVGVEAMAQGKGKAAQAILAGEGIAFPHRSAAMLLAPWAAAQAGDIEGSLVRPEVKGDRVVDYFGQIGQARLFERARRYDEAETDYKAAAQSDNPSELATLAYGAFLERRGKQLDAVALYATYLTQEPGSASVLSARARAQSGKSPPAQLTLREGAAEALLAPAATMLAARQNQFALAYLRLSLRLDPERDQAWTMVGDLMQAAGDTDAARAAYGRPKPGSTEFGQAQAKLAWSYQQAGDKEMAVKLARTAAASGDQDAKVTLADLLRANEQYAESAQVLTELIAAEKAPDWRLLYARGVAYERLSRWDEAQADLQAALKAKPDEPELLNYLGYSWIDRGERLPEALAMVQKAVAANPRSGAMVDSLGWAHYRLGQYPQAVAKLEQAVELEAGDPEINDHLGDAYWRVGRKDEALFQWRRVLTLKPEAPLKSKAEAKLTSGLGPDGPAPKLAGQ